MFITNVYAVTNFVCKKYLQVNICMAPHGLNRVPLYIWIVIMIMKNIWISWLSCLTSVLVNGMSEHPNFNLRRKIQKETHDYNPHIYRLRKDIPFPLMLSLLKCNISFVFTNIYLYCLCGYLRRLVSPTPTFILAYPSVIVGVLSCFKLLKRFLKAKTNQHLFIQSLFTESQKK